MSDTLIDVNYINVTAFRDHLRYVSTCYSVWNILISKKGATIYYVNYWKQKLILCRIYIHTTIPVGYCLLLMYRHAYLIHGLNVKNTYLHKTIICPAKGLLKTP